jgi:hypothetical protein
LECTADAVILQPEGIVFTPRDFEGPLGPGNPLDAALRATREYLLTTGQIPPDGSAEPYPLMLVRPDGYLTYYAVRAAVQSWGPEFGYELVEADWDLEYPPLDRGLAREIEKVVATARRRQEQLIAAAPSIYGRGDRPVYRAAPYRGGAVLADGSGRGVESTGFTSGRPGGQPGGQPGSRSGGHPVGQPGGPSSGHPGGEFGGQPGGPAGSPGSEGFAAGRAVPEGLVAGRPPRETLDATSTQGNPMRPGEWVPPSEHPTSSASRAPGAHQDQPSQAQHASSSAPRLAEVRGRDWALPGAAEGSVPVTRPIRVDCHQDRLVIVPETGLAGGKVISLGPETQDSVDDFVSAVWELIESWGIAGRGMYWRPVLGVRVAPGAEPRFADLRNLLDGSGLEVTRKDNLETAAAPVGHAPVER